MVRPRRGGSYSWERQRDKKKVAATAASQQMPRGAANMSRRQQTGSRRPQPDIQPFTASYGPKCPHTWSDGKSQQPSGGPSETRARRARQEELAHVAVARVCPRWRRVGGTVHAVDQRLGPPERLGTHAPVYCAGVCMYIDTLHTSRYRPSTGPAGSKQHRCSLHDKIPSTLSSGPAKACLPGSAIFSCDLECAGRMTITWSDLQPATD